MAKIFLASESHENWGSYQDDVEKEYSKFSGKKIDQKVTVWRKKDLEKSFYHVMAAKP
jgi:hypothetical protein